MKRLKIQMIGTYFFRTLFLCGILFVWNSQVFCSALKSDEELIFFPTFGYLIKKDRIRVEFHSWVFQKKENSLKRAFLVKLFEQYFKDKKYFSHEIFSERIRAFLVDNERGKQIRIRMAGEILVMGKTGSDGHSSTIFDWDTVHDSKVYDIKKVLNYQAVLLPGDNRIFSGKLFFIPEKGFSVITDIDDTVKISEVLNRDKLIQNTFFKKFQAVSGMSQLYHHWSGQNAAFHYVSGSPWQLYPFLEKFLIDNDFPIGTMHLKNFRFKISKLIQFLQADQLKFKMEMIESIIEKFPRRHFIFVGDSGEKDPEVYAALGRKYPEKVKLILIRDAGNLAKDAQRIRKVFPADFPVKWFIFHQAEELIIKKYHLLENLL